MLEALGEAGAARLRGEDDAAAELLSAVRAVNSGRQYLSPTIAPIVLARLRNGSSPKAVARDDSDPARTRSARADRRGRDHQGSSEPSRHQRENRAGPSRQPQAKAQSCARHVDHPCNGIAATKASALMTNS